MYVTCYIYIYIFIYYKPNPKDSGWAELVRKHVAAGGTVLGICGGYQMLGWRVKGETDTKQGIGLLPISSTAKPAECKLVDPMKGQLYPSGVHVEGFEIDCGFSQVVLSEQKNVADGNYRGMSPLLAYDNGKSIYIYIYIYHLRGIFYPS